MVVVAVVAVEKSGEVLVGFSTFSMPPASPGTTKKALLTEGDFCVTLGITEDRAL